MEIAKRRKKSTFCERRKWAKAKESNEAWTKWCIRANANGSALTITINILIFFSLYKYGIHGVMCSRPWERKSELESKLYWPRLHRQHKSTAKLIYFHLRTQFCSSSFQLIPSFVRCKIEKYNTSGDFLSSSHRTLAVGEAQTVFFLLWISMLSMLRPFVNNMPQFNPILFSISSKAKAWHILSTFQSATHLRACRRLNRYVRRQCKRMR